MKILFSIASLGVGGAQTFLIRLANSLTKEHDIYIYDVIPEKSDYDIIKRLDPSIKVYSNPDLFKKIDHNFPHFFKGLFKKIIKKFNLNFRFQKKYFLKIIRKNDIQIINSHLYKSDRFLISFFNEIKIPIVSSHHGCYNLLLEAYKDKPKLLRNFLDYSNAIFKKFDFIITAADKHNVIFKMLNSNPNTEKIFYGYQKKPIDIQVDINFNENAFIFGMVARGDLTKGWRETIEAFKLLQIENPTAVIILLLIGTSKELKIIEKENLENKSIIFLGAVADPEKYVFHFDVGLLPTYFPAESLPNTIIEYLAFNKPVISTYWAEIPQMIEFDGNYAGTLLKINSGGVDIGHLKDAMSQYLFNEEILKAHTKIAEGAFKKFDLNGCREKYLKIFNKFI
jgi:L-malate glycosyltransferase